MEKYVFNCWKKVLSASFTHHRNFAMEREPKMLQQREAEYDHFPSQNFPSQNF